MMIGEDDDMASAILGRCCQHIALLRHCVDMDQTMLDLDGVAPLLQRSQL